MCAENSKRQHGLIPATDKEHKQNNKIFSPVNYQKGDVKSQIASVARHLPNYYQFQTLGEYNALLSLFHITTGKVEGELQGKFQQGLLYFALNDKGKKVSHPFKASLIGKDGWNFGIGVTFCEMQRGFKRPSDKTNH